MDLDSEYFCSECDRRLTGFEHVICMDCANAEMVSDKKYTSKRIQTLKDLGYTKEEIQEEIKRDPYIKIDEVSFDESE